MNKLCRLFFDLKCSPIFLKTTPRRYHSYFVILTYLHPPCSRILLEKLIGFQLVKTFSAFYGTRRFSTAFASACQLSLSWASSIQSIPPDPTSWRSILILSSHLWFLPSGLFPSGFLTKTPCTSPLPHTCSAHLIVLDFITWTTLDEGYRSLSSSICSFLHSPVTSSLLGTNILLYTLFSNTLSLHSSFTGDSWQLKGGSGNEVSLSLCGSCKGNLEGRAPLLGTLKDM